MLKIHFYKIVSFILVVLFLFSCQETEEDPNSDLSIDSSTLDNDLSGQSYSLDELFFDQPFLWIQLLSFPPDLKMQF